MFSCRHTQISTETKSPLRIEIVAVPNSRTVIVQKFQFCSFTWFLRFQSMNHQQKKNKTLITWIFLMIELPLGVCKEPIVNALLRLTFIKLGPFFYDSVWIIFTTLVRSGSQRLSPKLRAPRWVPGNGLSSRGTLIELRLHNKGKNQLHAHNRWSSPFTLTP